MDKLCGIYKITNCRNGKIYVGQSVDMLHRFAQHKYLLRNNKHSSPHLQRAWNMDGESRFQFTILCQCEIFELARLEQSYVDYLLPEYNATRKVVTSNLGMKLSDETKKKISISKTNPSQETRRKLSESHLGHKMSKDSIEKRVITRKSNAYIDAICQHCGKIYKAKRCRILERGTKFCSRACFYAHPTRKSKKDLVQVNEDYKKGLF